ncbi:MAG: proteasome assembly chaperone family protein [Ilumatobacteraceae bacterium]
MTSPGNTIRWLTEPPELERPVMVVALTGWIDSGGAAQAAMQAVITECDTSPVAVFDDDPFIDFRARRPTLHLDEGLNTLVEWQHITVSVGRDLAGHDLVLLSGPEPDMAWHRFRAEISHLATRLGVTAMAHLGAYPFAAPHTRPPRLSITTPSQDVLARVPFLRSTLEVPAGICAILEHEMHSLGIPSLGIWAQVPHYVSTMPYPAAAVALLDGLREAVDVVVDGTGIRQQTVKQRQRIDDLIAGNDEHRSMLEQLERIHDSTDDTPSGIDLGDPRIELRSAEEIGAEIEQFLRDQD